MKRQRKVACRCGAVVFQLDGAHIVSTECLCHSCQKAGEVLQALPGAPRVLDPKGATPFVMHRKDRVRILSGRRKLKAYRLSPAAGTRRVVATCCNTPAFLEFDAGHWLSLYGQLWSDDDRPPLEMRTMTGDIADRAQLPGDVPNLKRHSLSFYTRLMGAWIKMGFRNPKIEVGGELHV